MTKRTIDVQFKNFWNGFDPKIYFDFLFKEFNLTLSDNPDIIIYSTHPMKWPFHKNTMKEIKSDAKRVFFTGENVIPDMKKCDYAISFCYDDDIKHPNHFRIPNYFFRLILAGYNPKDLIKKKSYAKKNINKKKFCNFIYSNPNATERIDFFKKLSSYKKIDSAGKLLNNVGINAMNKHFRSNNKKKRISAIRKKIDYMKDFKFSITFENHSTPGYTTEKLVEAMLAGTIPIYWGNPLVSRDFNTKSFINCHDYKNWEEVVERIKEIDQNEELRKEILRAPFLKDNKLTKYLDEEYVIKCFEKIFTYPEVS